MSFELPPACRELIELQSGVISRQQAIHGGIDRNVIGWLLRSGRWQCLQRGSYATFTGEPPRESVLWATLHRAGADAALSHQTAAELFKLADRPSSLIHVTIPADRRADAIPGAVIHRSTRVQEARHPVLLPPRTRIEETVLDLVHQAPTFDAAFNWTTSTSSTACAWSSMGAPRIPTTGGGRTSTGIMLPPPKAWPRSGTAGRT